MRVQVESSPNQVWLRLARWAWVVVAVVVLGLFIAALPYRYAQLQTVTPQANTRVGELLPQEAVWLREMGLSPRVHASYFTTLEVLSALPFFLVAGFIFWRKSDDVLGLVISISGVLNGAFVTPYVNAILVVLPFLEVPLLILRYLGLLGLVLLYYIFPDGRFIPRWTRWFMLLWVGYLVAALFIPAIRPPAGIASFQDSDIPILVLNMVLMAGSAFTQVYRYRYISSPVQRQQTKWVVFGLAAAMLILLFGTVLPALLFPALRQPGIPALQMRFYAVTITLLFTIPIFPLTIAVAILRYRLWDIDLVIRRTLTYSLLTGLLSLLYFSGVALLQAFLVAVGGQPSQVVVVITTLLIAALFNPLRRRVQDFIDRRFYRQKYDAEKALALFADAARSETDLAQLMVEMISVARETLQPEHLGVWLNTSQAHAASNREEAR